MNRPKRKTYVKRYGCEHTERYIQALETYTHYLEKVLDKACEELENYSSHSYIPEYIIKEDWKAWLLKDE